MALRTLPSCRIPSVFTCHMFKGLWKQASVLQIDYFPLGFTFCSSVKGVFSAGLFQNIEDIGVGTGPDPLWCSDCWQGCLSSGSWFSSLCSREASVACDRGHPQTTMPASSPQRQAVPPVSLQPVLSLCLPPPRASNSREPTGLFLFYFIFFS